MRVRITSSYLLMSSMNRPTLIHGHSNWRNGYDLRPNNSCDINSAENQFGFTHHHHLTNLLSETKSSLDTVHHRPAPDAAAHAYLNSNSFQLSRPSFKSSKTERYHIVICSNCIFPLAVIFQFRRIPYRKCSGVPPRSTHVPPIVPHQ